MGVRREDLSVTADPVFHLDCADEKNAGVLLTSTGMPEGRSFVAVSVRDWEAAGQFPEQLAAVCDHLRRRYNLEVLFLLMQPGVDRAATERVRKAMQEPSYLLERGCAPREMMAVLGRAKLCLAMRLHTLIFAASMAVPTLGLVYDPKVDSFLKELELPSAGHVERFDVSGAIKCADALMRDYDAVLDNLRLKSAQMKRDAEKNEAALMALLEKTNP